MTLALRYAVRSDVGLLREGNEDSAYAGPHLLAVADGMGGYEAGEGASAEVIRTVGPLDRADLRESELVPSLTEAVGSAKDALRHIVESDPAVGSMGTTLTAMLWSGGTGSAAVCHIGDSRAYLLRGEDLYQITRDHTFVQALVDQVTDDVCSAMAEQLPEMIRMALAIRLGAFIDARTNNQDTGSQK